MGYVCEYILINKYKEPLYWHIRKLVLNHDDADDILQDTFIKDKTTHYMNHYVLDYNKELASNYF